MTGVNVMCQSVLPPALGRASVSGSGDHGDTPYGGLAVLLPSARVGTFYGPQDVLPVTPPFRLAVAIGKRYAGTEEVTVEVVDETHFLADRCDDRDVFSRWAEASADSPAP